MQKSKTGLLILGMVLALVACNGVGQEGITATAVIPTSTTVPATATLAPTATFAPTATLRADGPLSDEGPYLVYKDVEDGRLSIVLANGDGSGDKVIPLPENSILSDLREAISPDGQWLAFHVGTLSDTFEDAANDSLTLNLMHLPDGEITQVASLLSDDFMEKIPLLADALIAQEENAEFFVEKEAYREIVWRLFRFGLHELAWSPKSNYLAFVGQVEGISTDVYIYEIQMQSTRRLSDQIDILRYMNWSPGESNLLFGTSHKESVADTSTYYLANIQEGAIEEAGGSGCGGSTVFAEWLSEYEVLNYCRANVIGRGYLYIRDLAGDNNRGIYGDQFNDYIYDAEQNYLLLSTSMTVGDDYLEYISGLRFYFPATQKETILREGRYSLYQVDLSEYKYMATGERGMNPEKTEIIGITQDGEIIPIRSYYGVIKQSPDKQWLTINSLTSGLEILSTETSELYLLPDIDVARIFWRPDSQVLFYSTSDLVEHDPLTWETELFYYDFKNDVLELVDSDFEDAFDLVWIP